MRSLASTEEGKRYTGGLKKRCGASALKIAVVHNNSLTTISKKLKIQAALRDSSNGNGSS